MACKWQCPVEGLQGSGSIASAVWGGVGRCGAVWGGVGRCGADLHPDRLIRHVALLEAVARVADGGLVEARLLRVARRLPATRVRPSVAIG